MDNIFANLFRYRKREAPTPGEPSSTMPPEPPKVEGGDYAERIDIRPLMVHLASGSWRNRDKAQAWLEEHKDLWQ